MRRDELIEELNALMDQQGKSIVVSPKASIDDIQWMIRFHKSQPASELYFASGVHTQIGGNRVRCTKDGLTIRPRVLSEVRRLSRR